MALETQDDYQDKIDDLMKEVEKLYDEGTDKGFKLKREEEMEQEERALETEKDYQNNIDVAKKSLKSGEENIKSMTKKIKDLEASIKATEDLMELYKDRIDRVYKEGTKKGFKLKRSEEMNLEERKQEILASIEARALETEKDYQREYDNLVAVVIKLKKKAQENKEEWLRLKKEEEANLKWAAVYIKDCDKLVAEAKKKGFKIKEKSY